MNKYPRLSEMGVVHPQQIDKYAVNSIGYTDVLRIVYERPKGSLLPLTRTYKFLRVQQGKGEGAVMNSNPAFRAATAELDALLAAKSNIKDAAADIVEELNLLQEDIALRSESIKRLLSKIQAG